MGCPDWPKCFGQWIPPTHESQLPANYREIYSDRGYDQIEFNPVKTWIEYLNRLTGSVIGLSVIVMFAASVYARKGIPKYSRRLCALVVVLVGFQGWLGATVVASILTPWIITVHMAVAILIIILLNIILARATGTRRPKNDVALRVATVAVTVQFILGSQVRQMVDHGAAATGLLAIGKVYLIHRSMSWIILGAVGFLGVRWVRSGFTGLSLLVLSPLAVQMASGIAFSQFGLIAALQPLHLTAAAITIGTMAYAWTPPR
jgi:cytochrome c oxidase assembly protein subunit 15